MFTLEIPDSGRKNLKCNVLGEDNKFENVENLHIGCLGGKCPIDVEKLVWSTHQVWMEISFKSTV